MEIKELEIDLAGVRESNEMHLLFKTVFGFPEFYGKNIHALIDCLSSLRYPEDNMTKIVLDKDEVLLLKIKNLSRTAKVVLSDLIVAIENVNYRQIKVGNNPAIYISLEK